MNNKNQEIYIIDALRSPMGKLYGVLSHLRPDDLAATAIEQLISNNKLAKESIDGLFLGCANQAGEDNRNIARMAALLAALPHSTSTMTLNSLCTSGLDAILSAARSIALGEGDVYIAGGVESMSRSPFVKSRTDDSTADSTIGWRFINPKMELFCPTYSMPETAELLAEKFKISRSQQDLYAYNCRQKYQQALDKNIWIEEIMPVLNSKNQAHYSDEQHRLLSLELLSKLPCLVPDGQFISSGNTAKVGDGVALVLLASQQFVLKHKIQPLAKIKSWAVAACHPSEMSLSAVAASQKLFQKEGLKASHFDWIELSEAFAVQAIVCSQQLDFDPKKVNPNGGALTIGNPIAVGSARLVVSLAKEMGRNKDINLGLATSCAGLGTGSALALEKV